VNGKARNAALMADSWSDRTPTSLVAYDSAGRIAIIADREDGEALAARLGSRLDCTLLIPRGEDVSRPDAAAGEAGPRVQGWTR